MPVSKYNRYFGGKRGAAQETLSAMIARTARRRARGLLRHEERARRSSPKW
jgi:hypothetical protein